MGGTNDIISRRIYTINHLAIGIIAAAIIAGGAVYAFTGGGIGSTEISGFAGAPPVPGQTIADIAVDPMGRVHVVAADGSAKTYGPDGQLIGELPPRIVDDGDPGFMTESKTRAGQDGSFIHARHKRPLVEPPITDPDYCSTTIEKFDPTGRPFDKINVSPLSVLPDDVLEYRLQAVAPGNDGFVFVGVDFPGGSAVLRIGDETQDDKHGINLFAIDQTIKRPGINKSIEN